MILSYGLNGWKRYLFLFLYMRSTMLETIGQLADSLEQLQ